MSIFDSSTPAPSGQKVPCDVGNSPVLSPDREAIQAHHRETWLSAQDKVTALQDKLKELNDRDASLKSKLAQANIRFDCTGEKVKYDNVYRVLRNGVFVGTLRRSYVSETRKPWIFIGTDEGPYFGEKTPFDDFEQAYKGMAEVIAGYDAINFTPAPCEPKVFEPTAEETAAVMAMVAPYVSPDSVMVGVDGQRVRGERVYLQSDEIDGDISFIDPDTGAEVTVGTEDAQEEIMTRLYSRLEPFQEAIQAIQYEIYSAACLATDDTKNNLILAYHSLRLGWYALERAEAAKVKEILARVNQEAERLTK